MKFSEYQKDKRVILPIGAFFPNPKFPVQGSKYGCEGTITCRYKQEDTVDILWDNGFRVKLDCNHLSLVEDRQYKSIW